MREARNRPIAGIQFNLGPGGRGHLVMSAIVIPNRVPVSPITIGAAKHFNPRMLIRRNRLAGELAADPRGLFAKNDPHPASQSGQRGGASAYARANNGNIGIEFGLGRQRRYGEDGCGGGKKIPALHSVLRYDTNFGTYL